jgi:hypothetical protein
MPICCQLARHVLVIGQPNGKTIAAERFVFLHLAVGWAISRQMQEAKE